MTQKTKLEIIGEYRKDHPGPFCTRDGRGVRVITHVNGSDENPVVYVVKGEKFVKCCDNRGHYTEGCCTGVMPSPLDLMCAREVLAAREFWVNEYSISDRKYGYLYDSLEGAYQEYYGVARKKVIHLREVLPGDKS